MSTNGAAAYLPPAERIRLIRNLPAAAVTLADDLERELWELQAAAGEELDTSWRSEAWNNLGILCVPGSEKLGLRDDLPSHERRAVARRWIASTDWRARCKRKHQVSVRMKRIVRKWAQGHCYYCDAAVPEKYLIIDHVIPVSRGGRSRVDNLVGACHACNADKSDLLMLEWPAYVNRMVDLLDRWRRAVVYVDVKTGDDVLF